MPVEYIEEGRVSMGEKGRHPFGGPDGPFRCYIYLLQRDNAGDREKVVSLKVLIQAI